MEDDPEYNILGDIDFSNGNNLILKKYNINLIFIILIIMNIFI